MCAPMTPTNYTPLALMAADEDDLRVVSAVLQDAVAKVGDLAFLPKARRFALVANRFVWEEGASKARGPFSRVRVGVHLDDVTRVRSRKVDLGAREAVVSILSVGFEAAPDEDASGGDASGGEGAGTVTLTLAGGGEIALVVDAINVMLEDISAPWRTQSRPAHDTPDAPGAAPGTASDAAGAA